MTEAIECLRDQRALKVMDKVPQLTSLEEVEEDVDMGPEPIKVSYQGGVL